MSGSLVHVEGPEDTFAWDKRLRQLAAYCRFANTAPVSFYGLRKVCDVDPLSREDRDVIRLEVKQLTESFEAVTKELTNVDNLLVSDKKAEQERTRMLPSSFSQVRNELDLKDAALVAAGRNQRELEANAPGEGREAAGRR